MKLPRKKVIRKLVKQCLKEDVGSGDVTARLTPKKSVIDGKIITREDGILSGVAWVNQVFKQVSKQHKTKIDIEWSAADGDSVMANQTLCRFEGLARPVLTGRTNRAKHNANLIGYCNDHTAIRRPHFAH